MRCQGSSTPKFFSKSGRKLFAPALLFALSAVAVVAVIGCAEIPSVAEDEVSEVTVEVIGGSAYISTGTRLSVPVGADTQFYVDVSDEPNTRIAGIWVDGGRQCCAEGSVVRSTGVSLAGVRGGVVVTVELVRIDTVTPVADIVSPEPAAPGEFVTGITECSFGILEYRLNKTMAFGYIKWWTNETPNGWEDRDSLQVVRIPADITKYNHDIGGWSYATADGYLSEGLQKFDLAISPIAGKRISRSASAFRGLYHYEIQFTDSLGNSSQKVSRAVWANSVTGGCP